MTAGSVATAITDVQAASNLVLDEIEALDPAVELSAAAAGTVLNLLADLVTKALNAYSAASGTPITAASVAALMPNPAPLDIPTQ